MLIGFEWEKFDYHIIGSQEMASPVIEKDNVPKEIIPNFEELKVRLDVKLFECLLSNG